MSIKVPAFALVAAILGSSAYMYWQKTYALTPDAAGVFLGIALIVGAITRLLLGPTKE